MLYEKINLDADEKILKQVRKHWFLLFLQLFNLCVAALFPLVLYFIFFGFIESKDAAFDLSAYHPLIVYLYSAWLLVIWMLAFGVWTNYYLDVWTITNKRVVAIDQKGLFFRTTGSFRLERLQDMNVEVNGIIATFLDYGTLEAETASGSGEEFRADGLPHPRELKALILKCADDLIERYQRNEGDASGV